MISISVVIATYNRCEDLRQTLESLQKQSGLDSVNYEIIIVDNNSKDKTKEVVGSFNSQFSGRLKYLFEPQQGQPFAHNLGIKEALGEIIVLTDDDCTFDHDYISTIYRAFQKVSKDIGFIGGKIFPRWVNCSRPDWFVSLKPGWWFETFYYGPIAILDYGDSPFVIEPKDIKGRLFYGANIAVRKEVFLKYGDFNVGMPVTQDTELQFRFLRGGVKGLYVPEMKVYHLVMPSRLTPEYYYRWYSSRGALLEIQDQYERKFYHPFRIQWSMIGETINLWFKSVFTRSLGERIYYRCHALFNMGQMYQIVKKG